MATVYVTPKIQEKILPYQDVELFYHVLSDEDVSRLSGYFLICEDELTTYEHASGTIFCVKASEDFTSKQVNIVDDDAFTLWQLLKMLCVSDYYFFEGHTIKLTCDKDSDKKVVSAKWLNGLNKAREERSKERIRDWLAACVIVLLTILIAMFLFCDTSMLDAGTWFGMSLVMFLFELTIVGMIYFIEYVVMFFVECHFREKHCDLLKVGKYDWYCLDPIISKVEMV